MVSSVPIYKRITSEYRWFIVSSDWERRNKPTLNKYGLDLPPEKDLLTFAYHQPRPKEGDTFFSLRLGKSGILFYPEEEHHIILNGDASKILSNSSRIIEARGLGTRLRFGLRTIIKALEDRDYFLS